jgi:SM-20-related protein
VSENASGTQEAPSAAANRAVMPPYLVLSHFLDESDADGLLAFALAHESGFAPTGVNRSEDSKVDPNIRVSNSIRDLGPYRPLLKDKLAERLPDLTAQLRTMPVDEPKFELELVAHNDGAFYKRHIDTQTASERAFIRAMSAVYYAHARPKAFTGGALRLYAIGDLEFRTFVDIAPEHNSLLVFPSWVPHEVMPIACPSKRFADSRFAVNCWAYRKKRV